MKQLPAPQSRLVGNGVAFTVRVDAQNQECLILKEALDRLAEERSIDSSDADPLEVFHAFEATIKGVARRLVAAGVYGTPLTIGPQYFHQSHDLFDLAPH